MSDITIPHGEEEYGNIVEHPRDGVSPAEGKSSFDEMSTDKDPLFLSSLARQISDAILVTNTSFVITYVNQAAVDLYGFGRDELIGRNPIILNAVPLADEIQKDIHKTVSAGEIWTGELLNRRKDGSVFHIESKVSPLYNKNAEIYAYVAINRDITRRKKIEEELRRERDRAQNYLDIARVIIVVVAADLRVSLINRMGCEVLGRREEEIIGKNWFDNFIPRAHTKEVKRISDLLFAGEISPVKNHETPIITRGGEERMIAWQMNVLQDEHGNVTHLLSSGEDITERRQAEDQIRASLKEKEVLLKEIHHRVKNNLQVISSLLYLQSKHIKDNQILDILKESQNRIKSMALIHESLYRSKDFVKIDFKEYITSLTRHLQHSYGVNPSAVKLGIEVRDVRLDLDTAIPCGLILNELVTNSLRHAFPGILDGSVGYETPGEIRIQLKSEGDRVIMSIADNGCGFPENIDFKKTESLGMRVVIALSEQLEGEIELDRTHGTTFTISFRRPSLVV